MKELTSVGEHGTWPTWGDAMAHCTDEMKANWYVALTDHGITADKLKPSKT